MYGEVIYVIMIVTKDPSVWVHVSLRGSSLTVIFELLFFNMTLIQQRGSVYTLVCVVFVLRQVGQSWLKMLCS